MRKINLLVYIVLGLVDITLCGCNRFYEAWKMVTNPSKGVVIGSVDGTPITDIDWNFFIRSSPALETSKAGLQNDRNQIMSRLIQHKLIIALAKREGIQNSPVLIQQVKRYRETLLKQEYLDQLLSNGPKLTEDYLQTYYIQHSGRFISNQPTWTGVRIKSRTDAQKAAGLLRIGKPLEEVALKYAVDKKHFVDVLLDTTSITDPHKAAVLQSLKAGQLSPVLKTAQGFEIFRRNYPLPPPLANVRDQVIQLIKEEEIQKKLNQAKTSIKIEISTTALMSMPLPRNPIEVQKK